MTATPDDLVAIQSMAKRLADRHPRTPEQIALLAFMAGTLYSLERATLLGFSDARMTPNLNVVPDELHETLTAIARSETPGEPWMSGFYLDSAMMRMAALDERIHKHLGIPRPLGTDLPNAVNNLKHDVDAAIGAWKTRFAQVLSDAETLCVHLETAIPE